MRFRLGIELWLEAADLAEAQAAMGRAEQAAHAGLGSAARAGETGALWRAELTPADTAAHAALAAEDLGPGIQSAGSAGSAPAGPHLFATLRVRDFAVARPWYERLFGEVAFLPHATEGVWTLAGERSVAVDQDPARAGQGAVTIFVGDLDAQLAAIAARGVEPDECRTYGAGARKALYRDPDGNEIGFGG